MQLTPKEILERFPARIALTDYCNLDCFICSNEGMPSEQRNTTHIALEPFRFLIQTLAKNGLGHISLTGGDPTLNPELEDILKIVNASGIPRKFFHTNGIALNNNAIDCLLKGFDKIAVSSHVFEFDAWTEITKGTRIQYDRMMENIARFSAQHYGPQIEIKHVYIKGKNSSDDQIRKTLDMCAENNFKFKFLNMEAIKPEHQVFVANIAEVLEQLVRVGCTKQEEPGSFRGQNDYLPIHPLTYRNAKGVAIDIGCGKPSVCKACYNSNETFINPNLEIRPCHASLISIPLAEIIESKDEKKLVETYVQSRKVLLDAPGQKANFWHDYNPHNGSETHG